MFFEDFSPIEKTPIREYRQIYPPLVLREEKISFAIFLKNTFFFFWGAGQKFVFGGPKNARIVWFFRYKSRDIFMWNYFGEGQTHICPIECHILIKKSRKVFTLIFLFNPVAHCTLWWSYKTTIPTIVYFLHYFFFVSRYKDNFFTSLSQKMLNEGEFHLVYGAMKWRWQNPSVILFRCSKVACGLWCKYWTCLCPCVWVEVPVPKFLRCAPGSKTVGTPWEGGLFCISSLCQLNLIGSVKKKWEFIFSHKFSQKDFRAYECFMHRVIILSTKIFRELRAQPKHWPAF